jgi:hypothetical protein
MAYTCEQCGKNFGTEEKRERHIAKQHSGTPSSSGQSAKPERKVKADTDGEQTSVKPRKIVKIEPGLIMGELLKAVVPAQMPLSKDEQAIFDDACDTAASAAGLEIEPIESVIRVSGWWGVFAVLVAALLPIFLRRLPLIKEQAAKKREQMKLAKERGEELHDGSTAHLN